MESHIGILAVLAALSIGLMAICIVTLPFLLRWLAEENIFFTTVREGTVKTILRGKSGDRSLMAFEGYHLNDPKKPWYDKQLPEWEVVYHGDTEKKNAHYDDRCWLLKHLGLYWVGWPWANSVHVYAFEWNETYMDKEGKEKVLPRSEATDFIFVSDFTYAIVTKEVETKDRLPIDVLTLVTVAIRNPYRALFSGEDWMRRITAAINRRVLSFVGGRNFQEIISVPKDEMSVFSGSIIELSDRLPDDKEGSSPFGLKGRYGVEIRTADLQTIELSGEAKKKHQESTTKEYDAKQEAEQTRLKGQAEADVIAMKGEKEAAALEARLTVIDAHGDTGRLLAQLDAMQEASKGNGNTVIWANDPFVALASKIIEPKGGKNNEYVMGYRYRWTPVSSSLGDTGKYRLAPHQNPSFEGDGRRASQDEQEDRSR